MTQFSLEPKDAFGIGKALFASLPLTFQRVLFALGAVILVIGWIGASVPILVLGAVLIISAFASRFFLRCVVASTQWLVSKRLAGRYAADRVLYAQLYLSSRDQLTLLIVEENTLNTTTGSTVFRVRLIRIGRFAFEIPIRITDDALALEREPRGLEWNPGGRRIFLNELNPNQRQHFWTKVVRVYGLPFQEIVGIGIPGGGTGVRSISLSLLDVRSGASYQGGITIWRDVGAPAETLLIAPFNERVAQIALKISDRFGMFPTKTRLSKESRRWRVRHGRKASKGQFQLKWFPMSDVTASVTTTDLTLGPYAVALIFRGPVALIDGQMMAILYVPASPYDAGKPSTNSKGELELHFGRTSKFVFSLVGQKVSFDQMHVDEENGKPTNSSGRQKSS